MKMKFKRNCTKIGATTESQGLHLKKMKTMKAFVILIIFLFFISCKTKTNLIEYSVARFAVCENEFNKDKCAKEKMLQYVYNCINYDDNFSDTGINGMVVVGFKILESGELSNIEIGKGINEQTDKAILKCFKEMNNWIPSKDKNGKNIETDFAVPIKFPKEI